MANEKQPNPIPLKQSDKAFLWKWTAVIALLALLTTGSWNLYQLYAHIASGPRIVGAADYNTFALPPELRATIPDRLQQEFGRLQGQLNLALRNNGDLPANGVRIQIKSKGIACLKWDDGRAEEKHFTTDVQVGDLPIGKSLSVSLWLEDALSPDNDKPLVIHNTGATTIDLPQKRPPPSMASWLVGRAVNGGTFVMFIVLAYLAFRATKMTAEFTALAHQKTEVAKAITAEAEAAIRVASIQVEACSACRRDPEQATKLIELIEDRDHAQKEYDQACSRRKELISDSLEDEKENKSKGNSGDTIHNS